MNKQKSYQINLIKVTKHWKDTMMKSNNSKKLLVFKNQMRNKKYNNYKNKLIN